MRKLQTGDVVCLVVAHMPCMAPIGRISDDNDETILLDLHRPITGLFDGNALRINRANVVGCMWAERVDDDDDGTVVFDLRPLAEFQALHAPARRRRGGHTVALPPREASHRLSDFLDDDE